MPDLLLALLLSVAAGWVPGSAGVGRPAQAEELQARDITVLPNGSGLPVGRGSVRAGKDVYAARCASCHGALGQGQADYPALAGGVGSLVKPEPMLTVGSYWPHATTLWDYIRRAMPYDRPGSLGNDQVYALTAYILYLNGILPEEATLDERTLVAVRMPNRDGFVPDPRPGDPAKPRAAGRPGRR